MSAYRSNSKPKAKTRFVPAVKAVLMAGLLGLAWDSLTHRETRWPLGVPAAQATATDAPCPAVWLTSRMGSQAELGFPPGEAPSAPLVYALAVGADGEWREPTTEEPGSVSPRYQFDTPTGQFYLVMAQASVEGLEKFAIVPPEEDDSKGLVVSDGAVPRQLRHGSLPGRGPSLRLPPGIQVCTTDI